MKSVIERILAGFQYILPQHFLSRIVYALMRSEIKWVKNLLIHLISRIAGINYAEALSPDPADYVSFNAWFTRALKPGVRVFDPDPNAFLSPCDGKISETGSLQENRILQAKGKDYSLAGPACKRPRLSAIGRWIFFHNLPLPQGLSPYPHAHWRPSSAHDSCARQVVLCRALHGSTGSAFIRPQ